MIQPRYGKIGDDHGGLALAAHDEADVDRAERDDGEGHRHRHRRVGGARLVGTPRQHRQRQAGDDEAADQPSARSAARVTILVPGLRGGRCMTPGSGTSTMNPIDHGDDDEELGEQQLHREQGDAAVDVEDGGVAASAAAPTTGSSAAASRRRRCAGRCRGPRSTACTSVAKLSSVSTIFAGLLGDLRAAAHGDADVGLLQRGGVVDGVAGHRHDLAGLLHQPGQADLVLGGDPAEDVQLRQLLDDLVVGEVRRARCR